MMRVAGFLIRRAVAGVFTLIAMITVTFVLYLTIPSRPADFLYPSPTRTAYQTHHANQLLGLAKPKIDIWFHYVTHLFRGDFGTMWTGSQITATQQMTPGVSIAEIIDPSLRLTLSLLLGGAAVVLLLAVPLGAFAGSRIGSLSDRTVSLVALVGVCTHPMVIAILVRALFAGRLHWFPPTGYCPLLRSSNVGCGGPIDWADHLALPWITFALLFLALYIRMVRASVGETLNEDYVRTARAKGAGELRVIGRHVLPNATLRILTMIGMEIGTAIGVCIYIETAYRLNGLASAAVVAMGGNGPLDLPFILAIVFVVASIVVVGNLVVDGFYILLDPRAKLVRNKPATKLAAGGVI
jgi:peptide/nickel transport system permease protein